jgi:hydroxyacylglutathione hydrolase
VTQGDIKIHPITSSPFEENTFIALVEGGNECLVVDPGLEPDKIICALRSQKLSPAAILITHGHYDHIAGIAALKQQWPDCPVVIGAAEADKLADPRLNLAAMFGDDWDAITPDATVEDGQIYSAAGIRLRVLAIPGHSSGHVAYLCLDREPPLAFVGDIIFAGSVGRTDFPGGSFRQLISGIREKLFALSDDTILVPGHGPATTVGQEKRTNPFLKGDSRD